MATALAPAPEATGIVSPVRLAHVVLRTSRIAELVAWYKLVLNATPAFESDHIAFLAYDDEHHRIAFVNLPGLAPQPDGIVGVHHIAFTYASLRDLLDNYARLRDLGILPAWPVNHGPTTSLYYADPDGNQLEFRSTITTPSRKPANSSSAKRSRPIRSAWTSIRRNCAGGCSRARTR